MGLAPADHNSEPITEEYTTQIETLKRPGPAQSRVEKGLLLIG